METVTFVPSSFLGSRALGHRQTVVPQKRADVANVSMVTKAAGRSKIFDAYIKSTTPWGTASFGPSVWKAPETVVARTALQVKTLCDADDYIAACAKKQYVALTQNGVYNVTCTEGASKNSAEDARVAGLAADFHRRQVSTITSFSDLYEARKLAFAAVGGCSYEESLVRRFAKSAETVVLGTAEVMGACVRYAEPATVEEKYMMNCVLRAATARATQGGCYSAMCSDGTTKFAAEDKRVRALSVEFRNKQVSPLVRLQRKFNQSKAGITQYAGDCEYEQGLFSKYPATAAAMRPNYSRY